MADPVATAYKTYKDVRDKQARISRKTNPVEYAEVTKEVFEAWQYLVTAAWEHKGAVK